MIVIDILLFAAKYVRMRLILPEACEKVNMSIQELIEYL
jgi:hypothetical protein